MLKYRTRAVLKLLPPAGGIAIQNQIKSRLMNMYQTYTHAVKETNNWLQYSNIDRTQKKHIQKHTKMILKKRMIIELVSTQ